MKKETKSRRKLTEKEIELMGRIFTDPQGSYTGRPMEKWEIPVQDVDDL